MAVWCGAGGGVVVGKVAVWCGAGGDVGQVVVLYTTGALFMR